MNLFASVARRMRGGAGSGAPERRAAPRVSRILPVRIHGFELTSTNVTEAGLQVECPGAWMERLRAQWSVSDTPVEVVLPDGGTVSARCAVTYVSTCEDDFLIGLKLLQVDETCRGQWQDYVERLAPRAA